MKVMISIILISNKKKKACIQFIDSLDIISN